MKIALAQLNYHIGNFEANTSKIKTAIQQASGEAELIVFSELSVCGYPPRDFLDFKDFISLCEKAINEIAACCTDIYAIVGAPSIHKKKRGKALRNSAYLLGNGKVLDIYHKQLLPTYDIFDENRYFEAGTKSKIWEIEGKRFGITICEDIWNVKDNYLYKKSPVKKLKKKGAEIIINIAASPYSIHQEENRKKVLNYNTSVYGLPIIYLNHIGAQTELIFDGHSKMVNEKGELMFELAAFEEEVKLVDLDHLVKEKEEESPLEDISELHHALVLGIKDYFRKLGFNKATLGLSGGIDSALVLALAVEALGAENVYPILMPSPYSSEHSIDDSLALCKNLDCDHSIIAIDDIFKNFNNSLSPLFEGLNEDITEENIQSRIRGTLLMAYSNKFGAILLNTSNKSELAVGYGTLYGDMAGGISVIGDLYKTQVYELSKHLNLHKEIIPENIIIKEPSAELKPDQKDSDSLPDYDDLDQVLKLYIEEKQSPQNIIDLGFDKVLVDKTLRLVNINEYKRHQSPPILRVSEKAFGMGRRMPIVGKYLS